MAAVATFLRSPAGQLHVISCEAVGADPAAIASNDYVGYNLRLGAMHLTTQRRKQAREEQDNPALAMERWIKEREGGG